VVLSLTELIRRRRIEELKSLAGRVDLGTDLGRARRRPSRAGLARKQPRKLSHGRKLAQAKT
jgi:hypothetical protein